MKRYRTRYGNVYVTRTRKGIVVTDARGNVLRVKPRV
jgi:hypothetical protein